MNAFVGPNPLLDEVPTQKPTNHLFRANLHYDQEPWPWNIEPRKLMVWSLLGDLGIFYQWQILRVQ